MTKHSDKYLSIAQAVELTGHTKQAISYAIKAGNLNLECERPILIKRDEVFEKYLRFAIWKRSIKIERAKK